MQILELLRKTELEASRIVSFARYTGKDGAGFTGLLLESRPEEGSLIRHALWLPDEWNGIFVGRGNGGMAGGLSRDDGLIRRGYASAHSDLGTSRGVASGVENPAVWRDFGWRATHLMTAESKRLIEVFYRERPRASYFLGTSTGGEQAIMEAERFPEDYDGILAGKPANNRIALHTYFLWNHVHLRTREGKKLFTEKEVQSLSREAARFFAGKNGGRKGDPFVTLPYEGEDTEERFLLHLKKRTSFSEEQLSALRLVYQGPLNPRTGERIYNGMPIGSERYGCGIMDSMAEESPHFYPFQWTFGLGYDGYDFDFDRDLDRMLSLPGAEMNAGKADLSAFGRAGGKLLVYSGASDPCVPYPDAMRYYERAAENAGGYGEISGTARYFLAPGMDHGEGGLGAKSVTGEEGEDLLRVLRRWKEEGKAPDRLLARMDQAGRETRPLSPYGSPDYPFGLHAPAASPRYQGR